MRNLFPLSVLMVSPSPEVTGGVAYMAQTLKRYASNCIITSFYVGSVAGEKRATAFFRLLVMPFAFISRVVRTPFDVIHLNPSMNGKSLLRDGLLLLILRLLGKKNSVTYFHGWKVQTAQKIANVKWQKNLFVFVLFRSRIIVLSTAFKQSLVSMGLPAEKISVLTTMFDPDTIPALKRKIAFNPTLLFMSRLEKQKGVYELLQAFGRLLSEFTDISLVFAGSGKEKAGLVREVQKLGWEKNVIFAGYATGEQKKELLAQAGIFVLPTYYDEGLPIVLLEAMAAGLPLLTATSGGIEQVIQNGKNGIVLGSVTPQKIEEALRFMLADPEYCIRTGQYNHAYAWQNFGAKKVTAK